MLNSDAFKQLAQLKDEIQAAKDYGTGVVVGTNGRFGFVKLDDGRDAYLSPEKMLHVIPGDTVSVCVEKNSDDKLEAVLEKLLSPALTRFVGQYRIKGKAHFIQPSGAQASRWIFVPPKARSKFKDGEYVVARLQTHPFKDGKAAAKVLERIGNSNESKFQLKYIKAKYQLNRADAPGTDTETEALEKRFVHEQFGERRDYSERGFVTIDAATTKDMDDALAYEHIEVEGESRHRLYVAIADPSSFIAQDSALARNSLERGQTSYLMGGSVPMLPIPLSHHAFSLEAGKLRPALICQIDFDATGQLLQYNFEFALITSQHKLAYDEVAKFLQGEEDHAVPEETHDRLLALAEFAKQRRAYREQHCLVSADQDDFDYQLDDNGLIEEIRVRPRSIAHQIVEEAMLATNLCGAQLLGQYKLGLFAAHPGFREERLGEVKALLKEENIAFDKLNDLDEHVALFQRLQKDEQHAYLGGALRRMMANVELSTAYSPHLGMGVAAYATITSPIRRYADLYNHWCLQQILSDKPVQTLSDSALSSLKESLNSARSADRELYQWLITGFAEKLIGNTASGKIRIVTQQGFGVKLDANGVEGFVLFGKNQEKKYDAKRMTLTLNEEVYHIGKSVEIRIKGVDHDKRRIAFELA